MCMCVYVDTICMYVLVVCLFICYRKQYLHGRSGQLEIQDRGAEYLDQCVDLTPSKHEIVD